MYFASALSLSLSLSRRGSPSYSGLAKDFTVSSFHEQDCVHTHSKWVHTKAGSLSGQIHENSFARDRKKKRKKKLPASSHAASSGATKGFMPHIHKSKCSHDEFVYLCWIAKFILKYTFRSSFSRFLIHILPITHRLTVHPSSLTFASHLRITFSTNTTTNNKILLWNPAHKTTTRALIGQTLMDTCCQPIRALAIEL